MSANELTVDSTIPRPAASRVPLAAKLLYTAFLSVMVPVYWQSYGPLNFLWFCDVALLLTLIAIWTEKPLPASMAAVGIVFPQLIWVADFAMGLTLGRTPLGMATYMFDGTTSLFARGLSTFHGWLPFLLIWLVVRLGYDRRALKSQTLLCWGVLIASFFLVAEPDPAGAGNVNKLFGPSDNARQTFMPPLAWLGVLMAAYPLLVYVPSHLAFRKIFRQADEPSQPPEPSTANAS